MGSTQLRRVSNGRDALHHIFRKEKNVHSLKFIATIFMLYDFKGIAKCDDQLRVVTPSDIKFNKIR